MSGIGDRRISIYLTKDVADKLFLMSNVQDRLINDIIQDALIDYYNKLITIDGGQGGENNAQ